MEGSGCSSLLSAFQSGALYSALGPPGAIVMNLSEFSGEGPSAKMRIWTTCTGNRDLVGLRGKIMRKLLTNRNRETSDKI